MATSNQKKAAPKKAGANKKESSHSKKLTTGQPEMATEPEEINATSDEQAGTVETAEEIAEHLKKNKS